MGYIILGIFTLFLGWCLKMWWVFNKWIAISIPISIILILYFAAIQ